MWLKATKAEIIRMCGGNSTQAMCIVLGGGRKYMWAQIPDDREYNIRVELVPGETHLPGMVKIQILE